MSLRDTPINPANSEKFNRIRQFQRLRIFHHHLNKAIDESKLYIEFQDEPTVILLYGPSGAGKTTVVEHLLKTILNEHEDEMQSNPGHIPVAYVRTMAPSKREFNWRYFYYLANKSIGDPFPLHKTRYKPLDALNLETFNYSKNDTTEIEYIDSLISNIKNRDVHVMFVDEAQHLAEGATWQSIQKQMNHLKTFTDAAGSLIFLCGTYDLLPFRAQNGRGSRGW